MSRQSLKELPKFAAAIYGGSDFSALTFTIHNSKFLIGDFINNVSHQSQVLPTSSNELHTCTAILSCRLPAGATPRLPDRAV